MTRPQYLRARGPSGQITSEVLHVAVPTWHQGTALAPFATPLCDEQITGQWERTAPTLPGWARHAAWPICRRCIMRLAQISESIAEHTR